MTAPVGVAAMHPADAAAAAAALAAAGMEAATKPAAVPCWAGSAAVATANLAGWPAGAAHQAYTHAPAAAPAATSSASARWRHHSARRLGSAPAAAAGGGGALLGPAVPPVAHASQLPPCAEVVAQMFKSDRLSYSMTHRTLRLTCIAAILNPKP